MINNIFAVKRGWLIAAVLLAHCANNSGKNQETITDTGSGLTPTDSAMAAQQATPNAAYPLPPATPDKAPDKPDTQQRVANNKVGSFYERAAQSGKTIITLADIAIAQASSKEIKLLARNIKREHTPLLANLQVAGTPGNDTALSADKETIFSTVKSESGTTFDNRWLDAMIAEQNNTIQAYEGELAATSNEKVKKMIDKALPTIRKHKQALEAIRQKG